MSSRSVATLLPARFERVADRALIQISSRGARAFLLRPRDRRLRIRRHAEAEVASRCRSAAPERLPQGRSATTRRSCPPPHADLARRPARLSWLSVDRGRNRRASAAPYRRGFAGVARRHSRAATPRTCSSRTRRARLFLLVLGETTAIDLKRVHEKIGAQGRVSFGSAELLEEVWGVRPGAVTPFGAINDEAGKVRVVLDEAMMRHRTAQLSSAGQHPHHRPCERRPGQIPARDRARAAGRGARAGSAAG